MTTPIVLYGVFVASKIGKTGLSPTVNVRAVERSTGTVTTVASGAAAFVIGDGVYGYQVATATPTTHDYLAVFKTTDASVDAQEVQAVWPPLAGAFAVELARLDAAMSSRLAAAAYNAPLDSTATQAAAAAAIAAADMATATAVAALPDALLDDEEVAAGVTVRTALAAAGSAGNPWLEPMDGTTYPAPLAGYYLQRLANNQVELVQTFNPESMELSYYYGDDYSNVDGRAQLFDTVHDLSAEGTTVTWRVARAGTVIEVAGTIVNAGQYMLAPSATQLASIGVGKWAYDLEIRLAGVRSVTEIAGVVTIRKDVR